MNPLTFWYYPEQQADETATTPAELDILIDRLAARSHGTRAALAEITLTHDLDAGGVLYAGFQHDAGVALYAGPHGEHEHYSHDPTNTDTTPTTWMYQHNDHDFPANAHLPAHLIRRTIHDYATTAALPTTITWQHWQPPTTADHDFPDLIHPPHNPEQAGDDQPHQW